MAAERQRINQQLKNQLIDHQPSDAMTWSRKSMATEKWAYELLVFVLKMSSPSHLRQTTTGNHHSQTENSYNSKVWNFTTPENYCKMSGAAHHKKLVPQSPSQRSSIGKTTKSTFQNERSSFFEISFGTTTNNLSKKKWSDTNFKLHNWFCCSQYRVHQ